MERTAKSFYRAEAQGTRGRATPSASSSSSAHELGQPFADSLSAAAQRSSRRQQRLASTHPGHLTKLLSSLWGGAAASSSSSLSGGLSGPNRPGDGSTAVLPWGGSQGKGRSAAGSAGSSSSLQRRGAPRERPGAGRERVKSAVRGTFFLLLGVLPGVLLGLLLRPYLVHSSPESKSSLGAPSQHGQRVQAVQWGGPGPHLLLTGSVGERVQQLCAARAYMLSLPAPFSATWLPDADAGFARFSDLFTAPPSHVWGPMKVSDTWPPGLEGHDGASIRVLVQTGRGPDSAGAAAGDPGLAPWATGSTVHLHPVTDRAAQNLTFRFPSASDQAAWMEAVKETPFFRAFGLSWLEDSAAAAAAECPRLLAPSKPVRQILGADREHLGRAVQSTGVYMEERREGEACPGCGDSYPLVLCAARHITMEFLRDSAVEFVVGGALAPKALFVAGIFHETRAPWVPATVSRRSELDCHSMPELLAPPTAGEAPDESKMSPRMLAEHREKQRLRANRTLVVERLRECTAHQMAELFLLGLSQSLLHTIPSGAAFFIASRTAMPKPHVIRTFLEPSSPPVWAADTVLAGKAGTEGRGGPSGAATWAGFPQRCVCLLPYLDELAAYPYAENVIIDKELKIVYCSVEKVGSTSLKMFLRSLRGLPHITDYFFTHDRKRNGLQCLFPNFKGAAEAAGIRQMTRRDFLKILFVRNPFPRVLSTYMDKHMKGDSRNESATSISGRAKYTFKMFGQDFADLFAFHNISFVPWGQPITFHTFVKLASKAIVRRERPNQHIATQTSLCRLDAVKYDFVGHMETFQEDVESLVAVMERHLGGTRNVSAHRGVFDLGKKVHRTNSDEKMREMYTEEAARIVRELYSVDMDVPLNGIRYEVPGLLHKFCGS